MTFRVTLETGEQFTLEAANEEEANEQAVDFAPFGTVKEIEEAD